MDPPLREKRDTLLTTDRASTVVFEPVGDDKVRVRTATWEQEVVVEADEAIEIVALGKSLRVVIAPRPLQSLNYDPNGSGIEGNGPAT